MTQARLIVDTNVREFFQGLVNDAVANQHVETTEETLYYVVNLLVAFSDSRVLYEQTADGLQIKPLAFLYGEALEASSDNERNHALRQLGDLALFISGIFTDSLNRKPVDVDYYIAMGGNAYGYLSDVTQNTSRWQAFSEIFDELGNKFPAFVDVLGEVSENTHLRSDTDIMRLYEVWARTGSKRSENKLRRLGIEPVHGSVSHRQH
jgi:hypothetical protein